MGGSGKNFHREDWDPDQASPDNPGNPAPYVPTTTYQPFGAGTLSSTGGTNVYHSDPYTGQPDVAASNPADVERDHYRQIGDDMARRQAVQLNFGTADQDRQNNLGARDTQIEAGNMMRNAAVGGAPSRAAIEANTVGDQSLEAQLGAGAGQRGPATGLQTAAANGAVGLQLQGANAAGLGRSAETNRALLSYGQNTGTMRKGDYTQQQLDQRQAEAQAQQQLEQNARNQTGQMGMERLGLGTEKAAMDLSNREADLNNAAANSTEQQRLDESKRGEQTYKDVSNLVSDARAKQKANLPGLAAKGRELMAQTNANRDSLRYGSSLDHGKPTDDVDEGDVNRIRYGHEPYRGDMFARSSDRETAGDTTALHRGIERQLALDAAREEHESDPNEMQVSDRDMMREHRANPRGYDLGSGYSDDPDKHYGAPNGNTYAPGTEDWLEYGKPRMVSRPKAGTNPDDYIDGQAPMERVNAPMDPYSRSVALSDVGAKRAAFLDGMRTTQQMHDTGIVPPHPEYMREAPKSMTRAEAHADPEYMKQHAQEVEELQRSEREAGRPAPTMNTMLPSERRNFADDIYNTAERLTRPGEAPRKIQQPGPVTARPVPPPVSDAGDFNKGLELQFGGPPRSEKPDTRAQQHLERAKTMALLDTAPERMSDQDAKVTSHGEQRALQQDANRKLVGSTYTYKDGVGEDPNQVHHGQMAQTMEENPITATAVRNDPKGGFKRVSEFDKLNVTAAGVAELQHQQDEMAAELEKLRGRRRRTA